MLPAQARRLPGQLPAEVTGFVGRDAELAQLTALLTHARIVTVTGYGGVGKTRLALRAVDGSAHRYTDGVVLVDLASIRDPALLLPALCAAVGVTWHAARPDDGQQDEHPAHSAAERTAAERSAAEGSNHGAQMDGAQMDTVLHYLRDRRLLLILDTCEHMIEPCARLAEQVLRHAAGVTVLATSRQPLDIPGEYVLSVAPLPVPGIAAGPDSGSAVELLVQRAASVIPGFSVTSENRAALIALCQRLDGVPLAIELAALRMRALPLQELTAAPGVPVRMLTGARRTGAGRHQTIGKSIEWSRVLCTPVERTTWTRLSVFAGSFDLAAAEAVCGGDLKAGQVTEAVIGLVDKSVLLREPPSPDLPGPVLLASPAGRAGHAVSPATTAHLGEPASRYRLPRAAREAGAESLTRAIDGGAAIRERYVAHWTAAAEHFASHIIDDQLSQYRGLRREHANLTAACELALAIADADADAGSGADHAARLATALSSYWVMAGRLREGRHWLDQAADRWSRPARARARILAVRAFLSGEAGDIVGAHADAQASIALAAQAGDPVAAARGDVALHRALSWDGDLAGAARVASRAVPVLEEAGDVLGLAQLEIQSGLALVATAPRECAEICARASGRLPAGELWATSSLLAIMALALYPDGDLGAAAEAATRALAMKHELGDVPGIASGIAILGFLASYQGRHERAALLLGAAASLWEQAGIRHAGSPAVEDRHRKASRAALDSLGEVAYASLRAAGAAMPLDDVITLASGLDTDPGMVPRGAPWPAEESAVAPVGPLTGREVQIAALVACGLSNREIAERVGVAKRTVDAHVDHIFTKLHISSRIQLTNWLRDRIPSARSGQDPDGPV
jgi:predicted ATPase/DNA-binding CsgD family transcriptional regulator